VQFSTTPVSIGICYGTSVQFNDGSSITSPDTLQSWSWNFGDGSLLNTNQNSSHFYATANSYNVHLTVVSDFGCSDSIIKPITINPNPTVNFTGNPAIGCEPLCVFFQDSSMVATGNNILWVWNFGDGSPISNSSNFEHCYTNDSVFSSNSFTISLTVTSDSGCVSSLSKNNYITVYPNPKANFSVDPKTTTIINPVFSITDLSAGANFWNWNFGDLTTSIISNPPPHTYKADTATYVITLITSSQYGCADTAHQTVIIEDDFVFYIPNSFTPNDDGVNDSFFGKGVGIVKYELSIFDRWGNMVFYADDINKAWDGKANHGTEIAQMDVYVWKVTLTDVFNKVHKYIGTVTLVQ
jgi:gliding motility-associated-like protein